MVRTNVANCGSWVKDAWTYDTYAELTEGKPHLFNFPRKETEGMLIVCLDKERRS